MNKHQKEQIMKAIDGLIKVHEIICKQIQLLSYDDLYHMLTECQNTAFEVGNRIERLEGENAPVIKLLEDYCEMLYQCSTTPEDTIHNPDEKKKLLDKILIEAENKIRNEIKTKYEIVFLPYKASMWDSLESIWTAAKEDNRCTCRVIPIPYYDKNPDGSFSIMQNDEDEFPEYVPVINYKEYDLKENRPDIIYFHNPYDKFNFVTSVHPSFYSSELKKCTDLLIYVPYFVSMELLPKHLSDTMGVFIADKVIVQSEVIKDIYQKAYIELLGKEQKDKEMCSGIVNQEYWKLLNKAAEEKFVPLGSPKIDKVIFQMDHKSDMPKEWEKIIRYSTGKYENEDISDVKIILYNTSVTDLLTYREKGIDKIKTVQQTFKGRTDAVLLWRPHPLNVATIKSMAPGILKEYLRVIDEYRKEAYGIYDDSADIHRAISLADVYYGDSHSSVIEMFGITGKPIMYQNMQITEIQPIEEKYSIGFEDFVFDGENIWFSDVNSNGLYRMNVNTKITEFINKLPEDSEDEIRLYLSGALQDDNLVFAPFKAKTGFIYNLTTGKINLINTNDTINEGSRPEKYSCVVSYKDRIYMLPCYYQAIGCYSIHKNVMQYETSWFKELAKQCRVMDDTLCRRYLVIKDRYLMIPLCSANAVLEYDMQEELIKLFVVGEAGNSYSGICYDGRYYWLAPRHDGAIIRWNKDNQEVIAYDEFPTGYEKGSYSFNDTVYCAGYVWMFPLSANMVIKIHPDSGVMESVLIFQSYMKPLPDRTKKFYWVRTDGDKIYAGATLGNTLLLYDPTYEKVHKCYATYPENKRDEMLVKRNHKIEIAALESSGKYYYTYSESSYFSLEDYIKLCSLGKEKMSENRRETFKKLFSYNDGTCGERIHTIALEMVDKQL